MLGALCALAALAAVLRDGVTRVTRGTQQQHRLAAALAATRGVAADRPVTVIALVTVTSQQLCHARHDEGTAARHNDVTAAVPRSSQLRDCGTVSSSAQGAVGGSSLRAARAGAERSGAVGVGEARCGACGGERSTDWLDVRRRGRPGPWPGPPPSDNPLRLTTRPARGRPRPGPARPYRGVALPGWPGQTARRRRRPLLDGHNAAGLA